MQQFLLFQVGGSWQRIYQCQYALLKYLSIYNLKPPKDTGILIYTEQPSSFEAYTPFFTFFKMQSAPLTSKAALIKDTLQNHNGSILYCDTDTYPITPLESIFRSIANDQPFLLAQKPQEQSSRGGNLLQEYKNRIGSITKKAASPAEMQLAVIGVNATHLPLLERTTSLMKTANSQVSYEQLEALSFQQAFESEKGNASWSSFATYQSSTAFRELLPLFFQKNAEESIPNLVKLVHHLDAQQIQLDEKQYQQRPFYKKWMDKFTGKGWSTERYKKKF